MFYLYGDLECLKNNLPLFSVIYHKVTDRSTGCKAEFGRDLAMGRELMDSCSDSEWWEEQLTFGAFYFLMQLKYFVCAVLLLFNYTSSYKLPLASLEVGFSGRQFSHSSAYLTSRGTGCLFLWTVFQRCWSSEQPWKIWIPSFSGAKSSFVYCPALS